MKPRPNYLRQADSAERMMQQIEKAMIEAGCKKVGPDLFESSTEDLALIEQRITAAMKNGVK